MKSAKEMSLQEIFDTVRNHLMTQGKRSYLPEKFMCAYRDRDGLKCAVGCLIPDERYVPEMEGDSVFSSRIMRALGLDELEERDVQRLNLLDRLREVHDDWEDDGAMLTDLNRVARDYGLQP